MIMVNSKESNQELVTLQKEMESVKKLLILQLISSGISVNHVAKAAGISTKTIYQFIPKNLHKKD